jgi:hypothetical protein
VYIRAIDVIQGLSRAKNVRLSEGVWLNGTMAGAQQQAMAGLEAVAGAQQQAMAGLEAVAGAQQQAMAGLEAVAGAGLEAEVAPIARVVVALDSQEHYTKEAVAATAPAKIEDPVVA